MTLVLVSPPEDFAVSLAEAKLHLHEESNEQNTLIELYIQAATQSAEEFLGRSLVDQTWDYFAGAFPTDNSGVEIPRPPLIEVVGVFYKNNGGSEQTLSVGSYTIERFGAVEKIVPVSSWPQSTSTRIRFRAGYLDPLSDDLNSVPPAIKAALLLNIGHLFANRESVIVGTNTMQMPQAAEWLLRPHRTRLGMA